MYPSHLQQRSLTQSLTHSVTSYVLSAHYVIVTPAAGQVTSRQLGMTRVGKMDQFAVKLAIIGHL